MDEARIAVAGAGLIGRRHIDRVRTGPMTALAAVVDPAPAADAIEGASVPVIEVHISNVHAREEFRHHSYISPVARGIVIGFGARGYPMAIAALHGTARDEGRLP